MNRPTANALLLLAGAIWGMGFLAQSNAMDRIGPWAYTAARYGLASLALLPFALFETRRAPRALSRRERGGFGLTGIMLFVGAILQQIGIVTTSVTNAGFLTGLYVVFTPILALVVLRARAHWVVWPSALAAFGGIVLVGGGGSMTSLGRGDALMIAGAVFWAAQILCVGVFAGQARRPLTLAFVQFSVAALLSCIGTAALETTTLAALQATWTEIAYGGLFSVGLAFTLQTIAQRHTTAPQAAIFLSCETLFAALFGAIFAGERIGGIGFIGCALIFAAMMAVELVPMRRVRAA